LVNVINLQAAVFKNGKILGKVTSNPLYGNLISGKKYTVTPRPGGAFGDIINENDILKADSITLGLTNGKRGYSATYTPWVSFGLKDENSEVEFVVNLGQITSIKSVVFGSLYNPAHSVLPPSAVSVEISSDGKQYINVAEKEFIRQYPERGMKAYTDSLEFNPVEALYVKAKFKSGGMLRNGVDCLYKAKEQEVIPSNIYLDEVEVY
jgi:hexosaminidase